MTVPSLLKSPQTKLNTVAGGSSDLVSAGVYAMDVSVYYNKKSLFCGANCWKLIPHEAWRPGGEISKMPSKTIKFFVHPWTHGVGLVFCFLRCKWDNTQVCVTVSVTSVISPVEVCKSNIFASSFLCPQDGSVRSSYDSSSAVDWVGDTSPHQQQEYWPSLKTGANISLVTEETKNFNRNTTQDRSVSLIPSLW